MTDQERRDFAAIFGVLTWLAVGVAVICLIADGARDDIPGWLHLPPLLAAVCARGRRMYHLGYLSAGLATTADPTQQEAQDA